MPEYGKTVGSSTVAISQGHAALAEGALAASEKHQRSKYGD